MLGQSIGKNGVLLGLFAVLTTGVIAGTFLSTRGKIADNIRHAEEKALLEIVPRSRHDNAMLEDSLVVSDAELLGLREQKRLYLAMNKGEPVAVIVPATARDGYTGDIDMIVGINLDGSIAGVRVLSHRETPGLGDKVDYKKSHWVDGFIGHSLDSTSAEQWKVKKDQGVFDQFTGATITPRAVTAAVYRALQYYQDNSKAIIAQLAAPGASADE